MNNFHPSNCRMAFLPVFLLTQCVAGLVAQSSLAAAEVPRITRQPEPAKVRVGDTLNLSVEATGNGPLEYTWFNKRTQVATGASSSLSLSPVTADDAGRYWVRVSRRPGSTGTDAVLVRVGIHGEWSPGIGGNGHLYEVIDWTFVEGVSNDSGSTTITVQPSPGAPAFFRAEGN